MKRLKKIICIITATIMICPAVFSKEWVNVSSWAYNNVSVYTSMGFLPKSFDEISDYTKPITESQMYTLLNKFIAKYGNEPIFINGRNKDLTREETANLIYEAGININERCFEIENTQKYADDDKIKNKEVYLLSSVMTSDDNNCFNPQNKVTIEQAIVMLYRMTTIIPGISETDGSEINSDEEVIIQTFSNGLYEVKKGNKLIITNGIDHLITFETDVFMNVMSVNINGLNYVLARTYRHKTYMYELNENKCIYVIPYDVISVSGEYIITRSNNLYGVYNVNGVEVMKPEYTLQQLNEHGYYDTSSKIAVKEDEIRMSSAVWNKWDYLNGCTYIGNIYNLNIHDLNNREVRNYNCGIVDTGYSKNSMCVLNERKGNVSLDLTWIAMSPDKVKEVYAEYDKLEKNGEYDKIIKDNIKNICNNDDNYTDIYHLTMTKQIRKYGGDFGVEGRFTLTKNGDIIFENQPGYISGIVPNSKYSEECMPYLYVRFNTNDQEGYLSVQLDIEEKYVDCINEQQKKIKKLRYSGYADLKTYKGSTVESNINGKKTVNKNGMGCYVEMTKEGQLSRIYTCSDDIENYKIDYYSIQLNPDNGEIVKDNSVEGEFFVTENSSAVIDTFKGIFTVNGDMGEIKSDNGKYYIKCKLEKTENFADEKNKENVLIRVYDENGVQIGFEAEENN